MKNKVVLMKRKVILLAAITLVVLSAHAQLSGTKWKGMLKVPDPMQTLLDFKNDSLVDVYNADENALVESMVYKVKDTLLSFRKISGSSPCDDTSYGKYKITWKDGKFVIALIDDPCDVRAGAFTSEPWEKIKN